MAIEYGITSEGFVIKSLSVIKEEVESDLKGSFGDQINLTPESVFGQFRDIYAEREHEMWELAQAIYNSQWPQTTIDVSLENVLDFAALEKLAARESTIVTQALFGTISTVISSGTQVSVENDPTTIFETIDDVTLVAGVDEIQTITFDTVPDEGGFTVSYENDETAAINYDDLATDVQIALRALDGLSEVTVSGNFTAGFVITFTGADGVQEQPLLVEETNTLKTSSVAVTITITETTPGEYQGTIGMICTVTGAENANAKTLNVINTPIAGFTSTFNAVDAILGRDVETNAEARIRRNESVVTSRSATVEAIKTKIADLNNDEYASLPQLTDIIVYENNTSITDAKDMPPHSVMAVVRQTGDVDTRDQEIAQAIFDSKAAGIETSYGFATGGNAVVKTVTDTMSIDHTINFARPDSISIYLGLYNFSTDSNYPTDGDD
ncbi:unnamed protein product, partial [marine sediment metagenome]